MVDLRKFDLGDYENGRGLWFRALWYFIGQPLLSSALLPISSPKRWLLRRFGADIGQGVSIRPGTRIKNPWLLTIGDHSMIGEDAWIDNLVPVNIGSHVCISQGAYLCTGNHDWSSPSFRYRLGPIRIGDGAWIGARAIVGPGVSVGTCAVLGLGSVATRPIPAFEVHAGNPAIFQKARAFRTEESPANRRPPVLRW
jgi:putative colanic acid biosynthesis acetyltransferase WcaF